MNHPRIMNDSTTSKNGFPPLSQYDYKNQAWVVDGRYVSCDHPMCKKDISFCYGTMHQGEPVDPEALAEDQVH